MIRKLLKPVLAVARHRLARTSLALAATFAGVFIVTGPAQAASTFNPITNWSRGVRRVAVQ